MLRTICILLCVAGAWALLWIPIYKQLPRSYWEDTSPMLDRGWQYKHNHRVFEVLGPAFLIVSPGTVMLFTESAEVFHQVTAQREAFPKPTKRYKILEPFGPSLISLEGAEWRKHRKAVGPTFNERNTAMAFSESVNQALGLLDHWHAFTQRGSETIQTLEQDTAALTLHIIASIGFGLKVLWPGETLPAGTDPRLAKYAVHEPPAGHSMTFVTSLASTLEHLLIILLAPRWLLNILPWKKGKVAMESEDNFRKYMHEFLEDKIDDVRTGHIHETGMDIMGSLVRTSYGEKPGGNSSKPGGTQKTGLSDTEIIGSAFINIVAGHETTANTLHFALAMLAGDPASQRRLQQDIDALLGDSDPRSWDYETSIGPLQGSMVGAVINETLRLMPPVINVPKLVSPAADQTIVVDGERHVLPRGMEMDLSIAAAHRNPRYWPTQGRSRVDPGAASDIDDFAPDRWFQQRQQQQQQQDSETTTTADTEDYGGFTGADTSAQLYRPPRGAFMPFSDGPRACLGRRIALVELVACLAVVFQKHSVELAVDAWASDAAVAAMGRRERARVYGRAQAQSRATLRTATNLLTLKLHNGEHVPVRLVRRGEESYETLKKTELETALDEYLAERTTVFSADPKLANYFASRARVVGSPIKKDYDAPGPAPEKLKISRRRTAKTSEEPLVPSRRQHARNHYACDASTNAPSRSEDEPNGTTTAVTHTPARALALASRIPLPATPADVANAIDRSKMAVSNRVSTMYKASGVTEATNTARETLSSVNAVLFVINAFEAYFLRPEILADRYAFTFPAIHFLGTRDYPVFVPDMFLLVTASFWSPALLWAFTSTIFPSIVGYFINMTANANPSRTPRRGVPSAPDSTVDPLTFSIAKAIISYVVYGQGVTFGGWIDEMSIARINTAVYGGYKGMLVGAAVSAVFSMYDAVLKK
ncbi:cytochrome P450 [Xylariomycetidae sp. FL0641]|nr:cytochrome P450 [Xylariomycetidae sp. FL0641]